MSAIRPQATVCFRPQGDIRWFRFVASIAGLWRRGTRFDDKWSSLTHVISQATFEPRSSTNFRSLGNRPFGAQDGTFSDPNVNGGQL